MGEFWADKQCGSVGEKVAFDILMNNKNTRNVFDVREDKKRFQDFDVDFLWEQFDKKIYWIEVKTDRRIHKTKNVVYEISSSGNIGCFEKTKADVVMYYDIVGKIMYAINVSKIKKYVRNSNFESIRIGDLSRGFLLNIDDLKKQKIIIHQWNDIE